MDTVMKVLGVIWVIPGIGNIVMLPWTDASSIRQGDLTIGIMLNMLLFILPGLVVYGIGAGISNRRVGKTISPESQAPQKAAALSVEDRLKRLSALKEEGLIDEQEYESRRREILQEL